MSIKMILDQAYAKLEQVSEAIDHARTLHSFYKKGAKWYVLTTAFYKKDKNIPSSMMVSSLFEIVPHPMTEPPFKTTGNALFTRTYSLVKAPSNDLLKHTHEQDEIALLNNDSGYIKHNQAFVNE